MKADLHCHSHYSDGAHTPEFVLERAVKNGITMLALTDHDGVEGLHQLHRSEYASQLTLINGVEISSNWEQCEVHVLGLCIDPNNEKLSDLLNSQQSKRHERMQHTDILLQKAGISGLQAYLDDLTSIAPGRSHVADYLVNLGRCRSKSKAFQSWLGRDGRCYVKPTWCGIEIAISTIIEAGGIAVLAHPHRYPIGKSSLRRLVMEFSALGGEGLEVCSPGVDTAVLKKLTSMCDEYYLWASMGSDFHSSDATWTDLGKYPSLPEENKKNAIWLHPRWHSHLA